MNTIKVDIGVRQESRRLEREAIVTFLRQWAEKIDTLEGSVLRDAALAIERQEHKG